MATQKADLINPEIVAALLPAYVSSKSIYQAVTYVDTSLVGRPGDTGTLAYWNKSAGAAVELAEGAAITYGKVSQGSFTYTVAKAVKGIAITDEARVYGLGSAELDQHVVNECGDAITLYADTKIAAFVNEDASISQFNPAVGTVHAAPASRDEVIDLILGLAAIFGDQWDNVTHITGHSAFTRLFNKFGMLKPNSAGLPTMADFGNKIWVQSDALSKNAAGKHVLAAFKPEAIAIALKKAAEIEQGRDMDTQTDKVSATLYCGVLTLDKKVSASDIRIARALVTL